MQTSSSVVNCCLTMEKLGLLSFLLLVLYTNTETPVPQILREYIHVENSLSWYDARTYCQNNFDGLFSVSDATDLQNLTGPANQLSWIGIFRWFVSWRWVDGESAYYFNWYRRWNCAATTIYGVWFDLPCDYEKPFLCQYGPMKWFYDKRYISWSSGKTTCENSRTNFAIIQNEKENYNITGVIKEYDFAWIGLFKVQEDGHLKDTWRWTNHEPVTFSNWFTDLFCAVMDLRGFWYDRVCFEKNPFVCFKQTSDTTEYVLINEGKTWHEAKSHCEMMSKQLVMVKSQDENTALWIYVRNFLADNTYIWIGLYNDPWYRTEGSSDIRNWNSMQPDGKDFNNEALNNIVSCVAIKNGEWFDEECVVRRHFFCSATVRSIILVSKLKSWEEALDHCRDTYVDLASVGSEAEQIITMRKIKNLQTGYLWTGLRFLAGSWFWVYGDSSEYENWVDGAPPQCPVEHRCGALNVATGMWEARSCEERLKFICFQE